MRSILNLATASALIAFMGCTQTETGDGAAPERTGTEPATSGYQSEIRELKAKGLPQDIEEALYAQIQRKHGMVAQPGATQAEQPAPKPAPQRLAKASGQADDFTWYQQFVTSTYPLEVVSYQQFQLAAGTNWLMSTYGGGSVVDPVMVVFQFDDANWKSTGALPYTARHSLTILGYNDDNAGNHPAVRFTPPVSGYYAVVVYAYGSGSTGSVTFSSGPACSTQPPGGVCFNGRPYETGISVLGRAVNPFSFTSEHLNAFKLESSDGGDPKLYVFDYTAMTGVYNDDNEDGGVNSFAWKYPLTFNYPRTMKAIVGGFRAGGTTVLSGYYGTLNYPHGPTGPRG